MEAINQLVNTMVMSEGAYTNLAESLQKKISAPTPKADKVELQEQMNTIDATYKETIRLSLENLRSQYDLGVKLVADLKLCKDLSAALPLLQAFQAQIAPLQASWKQYEEEIATLEGRMVSLLPANTVLDR